VANSRETEKGVEYCTMDKADMFWNKLRANKVVSPGERTDNLALLGSNYPEEGGRDIARRRS